MIAVLVLIVGTLLLLFVGSAAVAGVLEARNPEDTRLESFAALVAGAFLVSLVVCLEWILLEVTVL